MTLPKAKERCCHKREKMGVLMEAFGTIYGVTRIYQNWIHWDCERYAAYWVAVHSRFPTPPTVPSTCRLAQSRRLRNPFQFNGRISSGFNNAETIPYTVHTVRLASCSIVGETWCDLLSKPAQLCETAGFKCETAVFLTLLVRFLN